MAKTLEQIKEEQAVNHMLVTKIISNGCIETNHTDLEHDGANYSFFVRNY